MQQLRPHRLAETFDGMLGPGGGGSPGGGSVRDVVESDIWQIRGSTLYFFNQYRGLQIIDVTQPDAPNILGMLPLSGLGEQMYLLGDSYVVLLVTSDCGWGYWGTSTASQALVVDVRTGKPATVAGLDIPVSGRRTWTRC